MAETTSKTDSKAVPKRSQKSKKTGGGTTPSRAHRKGVREAAGGGKPGRTVIAGVVIIVLVVAGGYLWQQRALSTRIESDQQLARVDARIGGVEERLDAVPTDREVFGERFDERLSNAEKSFNEGTERMRGEMQVLNDSVAALRAELGRSVGRSGDHWILEEAERLLVIANQHLQLSADGELAGEALTLADGRLRRLSDSTFGPALAPVREMIADEIAALSDVAAVDVAGTLTAFSALARSVGDLPLVGDVPLTDDAPARSEEQVDGDSSLVAAAKNLFADLGALVQVETDGMPTPIYSAELRRIILEKTGLILESCQLAFLSKRGDVYAARMEAAKNQVAANFDAESAEVGAWLARWAVLAAVSPQAELPDISASLRALREVMDAGN